MADDDDWDTSNHEEAGQDPFNVSSFGGAGAAAVDAGSAAPPAVEEATQAVKEMAVAEAEPTPAPEDPPAPAAAEEQVQEQEKQQEEEQVEEQAEESAPAAAPEPMKVKLFEKAAEAAAAEEGTTSAEAPKTPPSARSTGSRGRKPGVTTPADVPEFMKEEVSETFVEKLSPEGLEYFNNLTLLPFSQQAVAFLNAYWVEVETQAPFIFEVIWDVIKYADMHSKGVQYIHLYQEGNDLDFNIGLYFYEQLCKRVLDSDDPKDKKWREDPTYKPSIPTFMTAIRRKKALERIDFNFDGRVSLLEVLLDMYASFANPADFVRRTMASGDEHEEILKARQALEEVNKAIQAYEAEKHRLTELAAKPGVKGLGAKHQLAILDASPLMETLNMRLITAEAAVRIATKKYGGGKSAAPTPASGAGTVDENSKAGSIWWLNMDLEAKSKLYGKRKK